MMDSNENLTLRQVQWAYLSNKPIPDEAQDAIKLAVQKYMTSEAKTLDEALGITRPKGWRQNAARYRSRYRWEIYMAVREMTHHGRGTVAIDEQLFAEIAKKLNIPLDWTTVRKYYNEQKRKVTGYLKNTKK